MYYITKTQWRNIGSDYKGRSADDPTVRTVFEGCIVKGGGTTLLYEHKHFEIIDD